MREIKFRMWNDKTECMYEDTGLTALGLNESVELAVGAGYILMQYTGLKDKNGKEIYEGDIIEWFGLKLPVTVDCFHGYRFMFGKDQLYKAVGTDGKIIGNIYENPELIEAD